MKKTNFIYFLLFCIFTCIFSIADTEKQMLNLIEAGLGVGPIKISETDLDKAKKILGETNAFTIRSNGSEYSYPNGLNLYFNKKNRLVKIIAGSYSLSSDQSYSGSTQEGIKIGYSRKKVLELMGSPSNNDPNLKKFALVYKKKGINFIFSTRDQVKEIVIYKPNEDL